MEWTQRTDANFTAAAATAAGLAPAGWSIYRTATVPAGPPAVSTWFYRDGPPPPPPAAPTAINPNNGPETGGTTVFIDGTGFTGATGATIGGNPCTNFQILGDGTVACITPPGLVSPPARAVVVQSPNGNGTLPAAFTYVAVP